jgi:hypothetical protein
VSESESADLGIFSVTVENNIALLDILTGFLFELGLSNAHIDTVAVYDVDTRLLVRSTIRYYHTGYSVRIFYHTYLSDSMSKNRDEQGKFTEEVALSDVLTVFETVPGPVVTSGDVSSATGCSNDSARRKLEKLHQQGSLGRRKTAGRVVYWQLDVADPNPVNPDDPIFTDRPSVRSGEANLSQQVDELLYGQES